MLNNCVILSEELIMIIPFSTTIMLSRSFSILRSIKEVSYCCGLLLSNIHRNNLFVTDDTILVKFSIIERARLLLLLLICI